MSYKLSRNTAWLLFVIFFAALFYFWQLGRHDIVTDESSYATRAIGMVDFDFGIVQPTPWQSVDEIPWWMHLSFHDHPPLVFMAQHFSMLLFGVNPVAVRIPSVLAGLAAVIFLYFIGKRLYSSLVGLAAAAIFAFTANHVWVSRLGLQESILVALMLVSVAVFLRVLKPASLLSDRTKVMRQEDSGKGGWWLVCAGALLGLAFLAKYLALALVPIFATMLWRERRDFLFSRWLLLAVFSFLLVASPVIIYNIELYRLTGHFDFQFSLFLGQNVPEWQARPGQENLGSYGNRIRNFVPWLVESNSPYFLALAAAGLGAVFFDFLRRRRHPEITKHWPLVIFASWLVPFFVFIGPAYRFLAIFVPWLALAAGFALVQLAGWLALKISWARFAVGAAVIAAAGIEALYSYNTLVALDPVGQKPWAWANLHHESEAWGYNALGEFFDREFSGKMPEIAITFEFPFAKKILIEAVERGRDEGKELVPWGIVYDPAINISAQLWVFLRRITYEGWPVMNADAWRDGGEQFLRQTGVKRVYFVNTFEGEWQRRGILPIEIRNPKGNVAFRVYRVDF